ncbi:GTP-binding protein HflX [Hydrogenoanaerobacterium saccharovorans]|uniref:GTPase HflX n=1 Tax=Hydrogenoanaerobacterium saccharovorans TaxID=474960 RepID=A0A1H8BSZ7_9FIRM|nr:GTPase HflX [Hydrogenoanaerobacterium saccharovorans]RPF47250.1 GTP-binding protein HflX [Hydrogenoanaerobacterium saccharovorans]SEM85923.1 GTP-binding protein HflX [Hydrogenoanaerobacterium saccharovorans]
MYENKEEIQRAILIAADTGEFDVDVSLDELAELAESAGAEVLAKVSQKRPEYDKATLIGSGRLEEVKLFAEDSDANLLIFDHELTASQIRNISDATGIDVIDRTMLILDIFAQRAKTREGTLQVELAQQRYRLPRLGGQGQSLSRLGGGIGTRGPGESKLESDRRHIRRRIQALEEQLAELEKRRGNLRARRKKDGITTVAIVGYTNVGKSTLLNALTDAGVLAEDKLFATLDPTARSLELPDGRSVMLVDTVGLVRRLPHHLVEAFKSTLEEAANADLLLNVCDVSSEEVQEQISVTEDLMAELGVAGTPMITVLNKCDKVEHFEPVINLGNNVMISAKTGFGFDALLNKIAQTLEPSQVRMTLVIPYDKGGLISEIRAEGKIFDEQYVETGTQIDALVDKKILHKVEQYRV